MSLPMVMPRIGDIVARIAAQLDDVTVTHGLGMTVQGLLADPSKFPAAVVVPLPPAPLPGELLSSTHAQTVDWRVGVYLIAHRTLDGTGDAGSADDFDDLAAALRQALAGWAPSSQGAKLRWIGGALEMIAPGYLAWRDDYEVRAQLRHVPAADAPPEDP